MHFVLLLKLEARFDVGDGRGLGGWTDEDGCATLLGAQARRVARKARVIHVASLAAVQSSEESEPHHDPVAIRSSE
jgi:hypothetical protein